ncbi:MAG: 4'-phosphopantetheinyl transferase superfamily protein [Vicingaceae bacterium]
MILDIKQNQINANQIVAYAEVNYTAEKKLFDFLGDKEFDLAPLEKFKNSKRRIEWMSVRYLLNEIVPAYNDLYYDEFGKPYFKELDYHLSISHSFHRIAVSIDRKENTAIDLQHITSKIKRIRNRYLNEEEYTLVSQDDILQLTLAWSIKEALFKVYGKDDIFLKPNIRLLSLEFKKNKGRASGQIHAAEYLRTFELKLDLIDDYVLAYVVNS